jgi:hypothetical protein
MRAPLPFNPNFASNIRALSKLFDIPQFILRMWQTLGFISRSAVTPAEWEALDFIRMAVWDNRSVLRAMLRGLPLAERRRINDTCVKTAIERIIYDDFLRFKLATPGGIMGDGRPVTYERYEHYLSWRHPNLFHLLTRKIFLRQRKAALARIDYARRTGSLDRLRHDMLRRMPVHPA